MSSYDKSTLIGCTAMLSLFTFYHFYNPALALSAAIGYFGVQIVIILFGYFRSPTQ